MNFRPYPNRRRLFPAFLAVFVFSTWVGFASAEEQSAKQTWFGTLKTKKANLRLVLELSRDGEDWKGKIISKDQGDAEIMLNTVRWDKSSLDFTADRVAAKFTGKLNRDQEIAGNFTQAGNEYPLTFRKSQPKEPELISAWVGTLKAMGQDLKIQVRQVATDDGGEEFLLDSVTQRVMGLKAELEHEGSNVTLKVPAIMATYKGTMNEAMNEVDGTWEQGGLKFPLKMAKSGQSLQPEKLNRPQHPKAPYPYREEFVRFRNEKADIELAGTLTLPREKGRFPAVVLVSGSGPQDRDETLMGHKPFLVIADYLTRNGIAVLRYDDRGTAESGGEFSGATSVDFAGDAAAAVAYLKSHDEIDATRVGLVGHSEGGLIAPIVEVDLKAGLAHFVMLAGPGIDGGKILISQSRAMAEALEIGKDDIEEQQALMTKLVSGIRSGKSQEEITQLIDELVDAEIKKEEAEKGESDDDEERSDTSMAEVMRAQLGQMKSEWFRYFIDYDPATTIERVTCPVLALNGSKDLQVLPGLNLPAIERALQKGGNKDYRCVELSGLNHLFQQADTGSIAEYQTIEETFSVDALQMMVDWIKSH